MKLHIVIFDDDEEIRNLLKTVFENKGHTVTALSDPTEFEFFNKEKCPCPMSEPCADILIADIVMPNIEGITFFKQLKKAGCLPLTRGNVAIMSGYLTIHYMNELNDLGIHYFRKPFVISEICDWIDERKQQIESYSDSPANG